MARPRWSVMIPTYESAALLERTLGSVLDQDPGPEAMQIEVVDDGSTTDDPAAVVARLGGGRVGFFRQPVNVGASANFTTCVRRSVGRWVHVLHGDDVVRPGFYERYGAQIDRCPDAVLVGAPTLLVDAAERPVGVTPPLDTVAGYLPDAAWTLATRHPLQCVSAVVARHAYERCGAFHPQLAHANDWELWTRIAGSGPVAWIDEPLGLYRSHPDSDSNRLRRGSVYLDDSRRAIAIIAGRFEPGERRDQVVAATRRIVSDYALDVAGDLTRQGWFRLAVTNAVRGVAVDPSVHSCTRAVEVLHLAVSGRLSAGRRRPARRSARDVDFSEARR